MDSEAKRDKMRVVVIRTVKTHTTYVMRIDKDWKEAFLKLFEDLFNDDPLIASDPDFLAHITLGYEDPKTYEVMETSKFFSQKGITDDPAIRQRHHGSEL